MKSHFWLASALLASTIIGVGMFALPFAVQQAGVVPGVILLGILTAIVLTVHLAYGEVVTRGGDRHRLVGHAERYLGKSGKLFAQFSTVFGLFGALLAYILIGGSFLATLFGGLIPFSHNVFTWIFIVLGGVALASGVRVIAEVGFIGTVALVGMVAALFLFSLSRLSFDSYIPVTLSRFFVPYGVILFALGGRTAIEEMHAYLVGNGRVFRNAILAGTVLPAALYLLFVLAVIGMTPGRVSQESFQGLEQVLGAPIAIFGAILGLFAVTTSYLPIGFNLLNSLRYDFHIPQSAALALVIGIPLAAYSAGIANFIGVIGIAGVMMGGVEGVLILLMHERAHAQHGGQSGYLFSIAPPVRWIMIAILVGGIGAYLVTLYAAF
ncbi:MAG: hypothetical protein HY460_01895 [Parcubacteria group bacterium]|nr:hypothetical protein [Parcubacteria group bacterium]